MSDFSPIWSPSARRVENANLTRFIRAVRESRAPRVSGFDSLYRWSVDEPEEFWPAVWEFTGIRAAKKGDRVLADGGRMPGAKWFPGARLNFAENLLSRSDDTPALIFRNERGERREASFRELGSLVAGLAAALKRCGIEPGDRVAGYLPNMPETVAAMLAAASIGAVWSSCSPDFGVKGVLDRFGQIEPKVIFTVDGYFYNGKRFDLLPRVREILQALPSVQQAVLIPYAEETVDPAPLPHAVSWEEFAEPAAALDFAQLPFDHPLYIMYSSGTTGLPKCMVHGAGGTLLQHLKELVLHTDLKPGDRVFYFTTCGWMMWNWLVSSLAAGVTVLLYDGSPVHPGPGVLFDFAGQEGMTIFGTSAKYLSAIGKAGLAPAKTHDLSKLKTILSTGSPLLPESYDYVYGKVKADVALCSISGGTDLISCFALGNPIAPIYRGELQTRGLGMAVEVFDDAGRPLAGKPGELVCTKPFPSMPVAFWNDPGGSKYRGAYFDHFPGVWRHGDWAELTPRGGLIIYGRSDATLNPGGIRIGTAEIYRQVEQFDEVLESLVVGQEWDGDIRVVLFVRLRGGVVLSGDLQQRIRRQIRENASPHHVPKKILAVADIPRTVSGKITELAVRNIIHGRDVKNRDALANPEALELFRDLPELREL